ncbi:MAG: carboxypeptidase regulatory-like domain-containing protein [Xanthomonadales bacterium]|nr:carboxypeptidase regulatory-like domain-containing protein [Xanthomonadales bacterium]
MKRISLIFLILSFGAIAKNMTKLEIEQEVLNVLLAENRISQLEFNQKKAVLEYKARKEQVMALQPIAHESNLQGVGTASISGTVQVANVDAENVQVTLCQSTIYNCIDTQLTDQFGAYSFVNLSAGTYYIRAYDPADDYINAIWSLTGTEICFNCVADADNQILLADAETRTGIDLDLEIGAVISGQVMSGVSPIDGYYVSLREVGSNQASGYAYTNVTGDYSIKGIPAGDYYAIISDPADVYIDTMWALGGNIDCFNCEPDANSTITLAAMEIRNGINFDLVVGATVTGQLVEETTLNPVNTLEARLYDPSDGTTNWYFSTVVDGLGTYTISGIPAGNYKIYLEPLIDQDNLHIPEIYNNIQCNACGTLLYNGAGDLLNLVNGVTTSNIDFVVEVGASISGIILNNDYPTETIKQLGLVYLFNNANRVLAYRYIYGTDYEPMADGQYKVGGLLPGTYFAQGGDLGREFFQRELYENIACPWSGCDRGGGGDPVVLGAGEQRLGVNYFLNYGGKISGTVTDALTGLPISAVDTTHFLQFYDSNGEVAGGAYIDPTTGDYISARALPPGTYSVRTGSMFNGEFISPYVMEKYNAGGNIDCPGVTCDLTAGNVTVVAYDPTSGDPANDATITGIDFALSPAYSFSGTITELSPPNDPIPDVHVLVYDENGVFANWATTDMSGDFTVHGLPAGRYYALTNNGSNLPFMGLNQTEAGGWIDILYSNMACPGSTCDVTMGTPIDLGPLAPAQQGTDKGNATYNFSLNAGGTITGQVRDFNSQLPASGVEVKVYNDSGTFYGSYVSDDNGYYMTVGFPAGTYYLTTFNNGALLDAKYGGDYCIDESCDPLDATPIEIVGTNAVSGADFELRPDYIFKSGLDR